MISLSRTGRRVPVLRTQLAPRCWFPAATACQMLGTSPRTLRRRIASPASGLQPGVHYRWSGSGVRRFLEVNVPAVLRHLETTGWR